MTVSLQNLPPLVLPQVNLNGTSKAALVRQQLAILGALRNLQEAMSEASPNGRDYQLRPAEYEAARVAWIERRAWLIQFATEIEHHADDIDAMPGR